MNKREAQALAKRLGVEVLPTATTESVLEAIKDAVDEAFDEITASESSEDDLTSQHALLEAAAVVGIVPSRPFLEGDQVVVTSGNSAGMTSEVVGLDTEGSVWIRNPDDGRLVSFECDALEHVDPPAAAEDLVATVEPAGDVEIEEAIASMALIPAPRSNPSHTLPALEEFNAAMVVADRLANSRMVPEAYRGRADDVLGAYMFGRELGLNIMTALRDIYMIDGRPAIAAHRQLGLLRSGGVKILESDATAERAFIRAQRTDTGEIMAVDFTMEEAKLIVSKNGKYLVDKENWRSYPADMLWARTVGRLTRRLGSDLIGGLPPYVAEEVGDFSGWDVAYGEDGAPSFHKSTSSARAPEIPEYRKERPDYNWPDNWVELTDRLTARITNQADTIEWVRQANQAYAGVLTRKEMSDTQRRVMFQKVSGALYRLDQLDADLAFDPDPRAKIQQAFAPYLDGAVLDGPAWRITATETDRPVYEAPDDALGGRPEEDVPGDAQAGADGDTEQERLADLENQAAAADGSEEPVEVVEGEVVDHPGDETSFFNPEGYTEDPDIEFGGASS